MHRPTLQDALNGMLLSMQELAGDDWWLDRKGEIPEGGKPFFRLPIFHYHKARHSTAMHYCVATQQLKKKGAPLRPQVFHTHCRQCHIALPCRSPCSAGLTVFLLSYLADCDPPVQQCCRHRILLA